VSGACVQQGEETLALDHHQKEHGVIGPNPCKSMHRDHKGVSSSPVLRESRVREWHLGIAVDLSVDEVVGLEVE
jgi:hypothetical protein